jgi:GntR family transcriptional regulator, vanillate catabolism transcriptional regulator
MPQLNRPCRGIAAHFGCAAGFAQAGAMCCRRDDEVLMSQTTKAVVALRELILQGELAPGAPLFEVAMAERLGVSRTPIRAALAQLAQEALLERLPNGGYTVRQFTVRDLFDAVEMRGTIEGLAARMAAERGVSALALERIKAPVARIDELLDRREVSSADIERYLECNASFHRQLIALPESFVVERMLEQIVTLPFASPNAFVVAQWELGQEWKIFFAAQEHHHGVIEAIEQREGARAEALAREHARLALRTLRRRDALASAGAHAGLTMLAQGAAGGR